MAPNIDVKTKRLKRRRPPRSRRGVTVIESAILLSTLLMVMFVLFDFGLAVFQYNLLSSAARYLARQATVHGSAAAAADGVWGPASYNGNAGDGTAIGSAAASMLATMTPSNVAVNVTWPNGTNTVNSTVQVTLNYTHFPLLPFLPGISSLALQAQSTMYIMH